MNELLSTPVYQFEDANHALRWSTEILRARRFPKIASFYLAMEREETPHVQDFVGWRHNLPQDAETRLALAMQVSGIFNRVLDEAEAQLLMLHFWGDFADDGRYRKAVAFQEALRREGKRVRLSYRYSFRQLGLLLGVSDKTAASRVRAALATLENALAARGLIIGTEYEGESLAA